MWIFVCSFFLDSTMRDIPIKNRFLHAARLDIFLALNIERSHLKDFTFFFLRNIFGPHFAVQKYRLSSGCGADRRPPIGWAVQ